MLSGTTLKAKTPVSDLRRAGKSVPKLKADYIQVIPLTIKISANSGFQTSFFNRITSPWSFLL